MVKNKILKNLFSKNNDEEEPPLLDLFKKYEKRINDYDRKMISNIIQLSDITVKEIMVPRVDVISIDINSNIKEIIKIVTEKTINLLHERRTALISAAVTGHLEEAYQ